MPWILAVVVAIGVATQTEPDAPLTLADGRQLEQALSEISRNAAASLDEPRSVTITERSVNAYLRFQGAHLLPAGISDPEITMGQAGRVTGRATVDLDDVRAQRPRGMLDPLRYVSGSVPVTAVAVVQSADQMVHVEIESVYLGSVPVPMTVLLELVRFHSRSEGQPEGVDLTQPVRLPQGIDAVRVEESQIVVVQ